MVRFTAAAFVITTATSSASAISMTGTHLLAARAVSQDYLTAHNNERAKHGASALVWDSGLASTAQTWANKCNFSHNQAGQNLYAGTGNPGVAAAVGAWNAESKDYNPSNPQPSHWTQVVWKSTTKVGCALATCAPGTIFPANYGVSDIPTSEGRCSCFLVTA
ncbi:Fruiting body protein SC7 OS=Schizophyllum commune GN=SC7 PE=2 SV=1 [Rhizoctonia solani AG-1 IB]|uniref:Fruiting body protein SC7 n=1 Tax=Thanatephorus cucumeris (strain AG1-IB / isolate 7/3/14) TaxID=1108050 RepID=A0A0B7FD07_THACB|nr:Fruiting body protein SC7 OS=Schizophyllum commune GN=SC7 PE=2 SV=1 [Rhizoctonia solani AG-1 IB]